MNYKEAKEDFIETWGTLGTQWGINRTMSQIHALLIATEGALSTEEIMEELQISRGNANMNIRTLMEWGLVKKQLVPGERREYFTAGKDIWEMARQIARERRRREIEPVLQKVEELKNFSPENEEGEKFKRTLEELSEFTGRMDSALEMFVKSDKNWFYKTLLNLLK